MCNRQYTLLLLLCVCFHSHDQDIPDGTRQQFISKSWLSKWSIIHILLETFKKTFNQWVCGCFFLMFPTIECSILWVSQVCQSMETLGFVFFSPSLWGIVMASRFIQSNDSVDVAPVQWSPILRLLDALVLVPFPLAKNSSFSGLCRVLEVEQRPEKSRFPRLIGLWFCRFSRFSRFQIPDRIVVLWFSLGIAPQVWTCECLWLPHSNAFPRWRYPDYGHLTLGDLGRLL